MCSLRIAKSILSLFLLSNPAMFGNLSSVLSDRIALSCGKTDEYLQTDVFAQDFEHPVNDETDDVKNPDIITALEVYVGYEDYASHTCDDRVSHSNPRIEKYRLLGY